MTESVGRVLVLGATGIIGTELVAALAVRGFDVVAVSRRPVDVSVEGASGRVHHAMGDARDPVRLAELVSGAAFDAVIDLVSFDPVQLERTVRTVAGHCAQFFFVSSATIFDGYRSPGAIVEESPRIETGWSYALAKIASERRLREVCSELGQVFTIVRPYITYSGKRVPFGVWESRAMLQRLVDHRPSVIGDEVAGQVTSLTHAYDLAAGVAALVANPAALNEDFNIVSDEQMTWRDVYATAAAAIGVEGWFVTTTSARIIEHFPQLRGKVEDREQPRAFSTAKLRRATGGLEFTVRLYDGYRSAIAELMRAATVETDFGEQGRMDRLVLLGNSERAVRNNVSSFGLRLLRTAPKDFLRYRVGRLAPAARNLLKVAAGRPRSAQAGDYGI